MGTVIVPSPWPGVAPAAGSGTKAAIVGAWTQGMSGVAHGISTATPAVLSLASRTVLAPFQLGSAIVGPWREICGVGLAMLTVALLYAVIRWQLASWLQRTDPDLWAILPRVGVAAVAIPLSLDLVRGLLACNNALVASLVAMAATLGGGQAGLLAPLGLALVAGASVVVGIGPEVLGLLGLVAILGLVASYILRAAEIAVLTLLLPIAAALWVVPAAAGVWTALVAELLVSIFVQSLQVTMLLAFATAVHTGAGAFQWLWGFGALVLLFGARRLLRILLRQVSEWGHDLAGGVPGAASGH